MAELTTWTASPFVRDLETISEDDDDLRAVLEDHPQLVVALGDGLQVTDEGARRPGGDLSHGPTRRPSEPAAT